MKKITLFLCLLVILIGVACAITGNSYTPKTSVFFSPKGGCTQAIVDSISGAKNEILIQAYSFTSKDIAEALLDAKKRKVQIIAVLDRANLTDKYSTLDFLYNSGIPVYTDAKHQIAHNKIIIIDGVTVITGSFNFTKSAETSNAENLLIMEDKALAKAYINNFANHFDHSTLYGGRQ